MELMRLERFDCTPSRCANKRRLAKASELNSRWWQLGLFGLPGRTVPERAASRMPLGRARGLAAGRCDAGARRLSVQRCCAAMLLMHAVECPVEQKGGVVVRWCKTRVPRPRVRLDCSGALDTSLVARRPDWVGRPPHCSSLRALPVTSLALFHKVFALDLVVCP
jgi:hypothetical protein